MTQLNPKQLKFCELYASSVEFFANGYRSYIEAYDIDTSAPGAYKSAMSSASRLLRSDKICAKINEILDLRGLNDPFVDKQLEFLITQHADFTNKLGAIKEYNTLRKRTGKTDGQLDVNITVSHNVPRPSEQTMSS